MRIPTEILVVGGAGYIGGSVTDRLRELNDMGLSFKYSVADSLLYDPEYRKPCNFEYCDVTFDLPRLLKSRDWDVVIWLPAIVGDGACEAVPDLAYETNTKAVQTLVDNFDGRIIFTSTASVYGVNHDMNITEIAPLKPLSTYASTKVEAENILKDRPNTVIFRLGTVYGVSDTYARIRMDLVVNIMTLRAVEGEHITVFGGSQYRPLAHVLNVGNLLANSAILPDWRDLEGIYNYAEGNYTIRQIASTIKSMVPNTQVGYIDKEMNDLRNYHVSWYKLNNSVPSPVIPIHLEEGIKELTDLYRSNRIKDLRNRRYSNELWLRD